MLKLNVYTSEDFLYNKFMIFMTEATTDFTEIIFKKDGHRYVASLDSLPKENEIVWVFDQWGIKLGHPHHYIFRAYWQYRLNDFGKRVKVWFSPYEKEVVGVADDKVKRVDYTIGNDDAILFWSRKNFTKAEIDDMTLPRYPRY